jgi:hypothetical protein
MHDAAVRHDPTGTTRIRLMFDRQAVKRFRALRTLVKRVVVELDVLGLRGITEDSLDFLKIYGGAQDSGIAEYSSMPSGDRVRGFMVWLRHAAQETVGGDVPWSHYLIQAAYAKGYQDAAGRLKNINRVPPTGLPEERALHFHTLSMIQSRTHDEIVNVRDTTVTQMARVLAEHLVNGSTPEALSNALVGRIDAIGITRARLVASTETVAAYNEAAINMYEEGGIRRLGIIPEWDALLPGTPRPDYGPGIYKRGENKGTPKRTKDWPKGRWPLVAWATAGDDFVCPQCEALEDQVFTLETARGMLPLHPNCRCALYPLVEQDGEE